MNKKTAQILVSILFLIDLVSVGISWNLAYWIRFYFFNSPLATFLPIFQNYLKITPLVMLLAAFCFAQSGLYLTDRVKKTGLENQRIIRANLILFISLVAASFYYREFSFSRLHSIYFLFLSITGIGTIRVLKVKVLTILRKKGRFIRKALIVGNGKSAQRLMGKIKKNPDSGIKVMGFLAESLTEDIQDFSCIGSYLEIQKQIKEYNIEQVFVALDSEQQKYLFQINDKLADQVVDLCYVPDIIHTLTINPEVSEFDGMPIITLRQSPIEGWSRFIKRVFDIFTSLISFLIFLPCWIFIPLIIKITSPGPILYRQKRMGLDGLEFDMLKFRSMKVDADKEGTGWTIENDTRKTAIGSFLRKTSLDEVPQFINVLFGQMSVVGPRPEQPKFIEQFKGEIPNYMLRHKMKAGITGWAQVNGWRGNTSLEKRIECDIYYMTNWSIWFDLKILLLTIVRGFVNKNAY